MAQQILPYFIREVDDTFQRLRINTPGNWHMYMAGAIFSIVLLVFQYIMLISFTQYILTSNVSLI
jgi:hypothetical protein